MIDYRKRQERLLSGVDADAFLVFDLDRILPGGIDSVSLFYLTGYTGEGALLCCGDKSVLLTDSRYLEQAQRETPELSLRHAEADYLTEIAAAVQDLGIRRMAFASWRMSHFVVNKLEEVCDVELVETDDPIRWLRAVKDAHEIDCIHRASRLSEEALTELLDEIDVGMDEVDVAFRFGLLLREKGSERVSFDMIVAAGENSSLPHYRPSLGKRALREGDLLLFDFGARVGGYGSDITRTVVLGAASEKQRDIYDWVRRATDAGLEALGAGVPGKEVHQAAAEVIEGSPYKEYAFLSGVGHGVGLEGHELPRMSLESTDVLEPGMVVTMEPGIYIPGYGGVRIEDIAVIAEDGYDLLTSFPRDDLIEVG